MSEQLPRNDEEERNKSSACLSGGGSGLRFGRHTVTEEYTPAVCRNYSIRPCRCFACCSLYVYIQRFEERNHRKTAPDDKKDFVWGTFP